MSLPLYNRPYVEFDFTRMAFDTRVSFSRSSDGTYFDAAGVMQTAASNVPRKEHNPATGAVRGLRLEEQRTNLLLRSAEFDNAYWGKGNTSVTANVESAPDGTALADKVVESATNASHYVVSGAVAVTTGAYYTLSVLAKAKERSRALLSFTTSAAWTGGSASECIFDLIDGTAAWRFNPGTEKAISHIGGGIFRCSITAQRIGASGNTSAVVNLVSAGTVVTYAGDGVSGLYLWGAQLEAGAYPTSYIPTTTATVTRSADVCTFTIPARVVRLVTIYDDGTTNTETVTPGASYTIPTGQKPILRIRGYFA